MTEWEWLECDDPEKMLLFIRKKINTRKLGLFAVCCCLQVRHLSEELSQEALLCAEQFLERERDESDLSEALHQAGEVFEEIDNPFARGELLRKQEATDAVYEAVAACHPDGYFGDDEFKAKKAAGKAANAAPNGREEMRNQCAYLRDIVGNPFRDVVIDPNLLTPNVLNLAQAAYDNRSLDSGTLDNDYLAILADALDDAGCDNADILDHLRGPGLHVRGCWVLDLLLNKA